MASGKFLTTAKRLQAACNERFGVKLLINTRQWFSEDQHRAITTYIVLQTVGATATDRGTNIELFKTYSQVQLALFLRDFWYELNNWEVPHDNAEWEEVKAQYASKVN